MKNRILNMSKDELADFLVENWHEVNRILPEKGKKEFYKSHSWKMLKEIALLLADQISCTH
jgi:hypothetical protein